MTRKTVRRKARISELAEELAIGAAMRLRCDSDGIRPIVDAVVAYLVEEYPSQDLYIPASVTYPVDAIRAAAAGKVSVRRICALFRISRATFYRLMDAAETASAGPEAANESD